MSISLGMIRSKGCRLRQKGRYCALILYNSATKFDKEKLGFDPKDKSEAAIIPVVFITREAKQKYLKDRVGFGGHPYSDQLYRSTPDGA